MPDTKSGWDWFGVSQSQEGGEDRILALSFARCFRGIDGECVLKHLRAMTVEQSLGPAASDSMLRHLEGQRQLVSHIQGLIERGRGQT